MPAEEGAAELGGRLTGTALANRSVHLWFDREITDLEHAVLLGRTIHWMYNKSRAAGRGGSYLELVVSASRV